MSLNLMGEEYFGYELQIKELQCQTEEYTYCVPLLLHI